MRPIKAKERELKVNNYSNLSWTALDFKIMTNGINCNYIQDFPLF